MYDTFEVIVHPGAKLPNPKERIVTSSPITDSNYILTVSSIEKLRWNDVGELIVTVRAARNIVYDEDDLT